MTLEERILNMSKYTFITDEDKENRLFFETCLKLNRIELALKCTKFLTDEFISMNIETILEYIKKENDFPYELKNQRVFRDLLISKEEYELLIKLNYSILKEIINEVVLKKLNEVADMEIETGELRNDYTKFRAMELKKYDLFNRSYVYFPLEQEFYDKYYEEILTIVDQLENPKINNYFLAVKCMKMGDFEYAEKVYDYNPTLQENEIAEIENKYWNKILEYNDKKISRLFCRSKKLFNHYLEQKRFDLISQFHKDLLTPEFILNHESEIIENIKEVSENVTYNEELFKLCLKYQKYELCSKFNFEPTKEILATHGKELLKQYTKLPYFLLDNEDVLNLLLELERYDLLKDFSKESFTPEVLSLHGAKIVAEIDSISFDMKKSPEFLVAAIKAKRYDLIDDFYKEAFTEEVLTNYGEEIISNIKTLSYYLKSNPLALEAALNTKRYEFVEEFYKDAFTDSILKNKNIREYLKQAQRLPRTLYEKSALLKLTIEEGNYQLALLFNEETYTEELIDNLIDIIPKNAIELEGIIRTPKVIKLILKKERYDLITTSNYAYSTFDDEILIEYGLELLTKTPFFNSFRNSTILLKIALENNLKHLIPLFSIDAFDEDILKESGKSMLTELVQIIENHKITVIFGPLFGRIPKVKKPNSLTLDEDNKIKSTCLLLLLLENGYYHLMNKFSDSIFTKEIIDEYYDKIINLKENKGGGFLDNNEYLFNRILQEEKFSLLWKFSKSMFTNDIIDKYIDKFIEYYKTKRFIDHTLEANSYFLKKVFQSSSKELAVNFSSLAYTKEIVETYYDDILEIIEKNNNIIPPRIQSIIFFEKLLIEKNYELIKKMDHLSFYSNDIDDYYDTIVPIVESEIDSPFAKNMFTQLCFVEKYIKDCSVDKIEYINKRLFYKSLQEYYPKLIEWIIKYNNSQIPLELIISGNLKQYCKEQNLTELYLNFTIKDDLNNNSLDEIIDEYSKILKIDPSVLKGKLELLLSKNDEILTTILPKMLLEKTERIPLNHFMTITLYPDLQYEILQLNDQEFYTVERILNYTNNSDIDITSILYNVLKNIKHYKKLVTNSQNITDEQIANLIYILQRENNIFNINDIEELTYTLFAEKILSKFSEYDKQIEQETNLDKLKEMLLLKKYGLDIEEAKFITERYCLDKNIVLNSELDEYLKTIIIDLYDILDCNNIEELKFYYNTSDILLADYRSMIYLEAQIRKEYAKLYSKQLYKLQDSELLENQKHLISNPESLEQLSKVNYKGTKPKIYILSEDFNLEIHALGAYSGYERPADFLEDWDRPKMASHGVCTSFIGNNQIANARAHHPILGFDTINGNSLLLSANYDIGSSSANLSYKTSKEMVTNFLPPKELIDYTRHTHNEIVIERMKYESGVICKKKPSYIVYLLDDINNKYNFMTKSELIEEYRSKGKKDELIQNILTEKNTYFVDNLLKSNQITIEEANQIKNVFYYEEVVQASIDIGVPIVIVDRLYYAKRELKKCEVIYETLITTDEIEYITLLFLTYFNNMIGCIDYTNSDLEYNKCFSEEGFQQLFNKLLEDIEQKDKNIQLNYLDTILYELEKEDYKRQTFTGGAARHLGSIPPYITTIKTKMDELRLQVTEVQNEPSTKPKK